MPRIVERVQNCHVCGGRGMVPARFYDLGRGLTGRDETVVPCRRCQAAIPTLEKNPKFEKPALPEEDR